MTLLLNCRSYLYIIVMFYQVIFCKYLLGCGMPSFLLCLLMNRSFNLDVVWWILFYLGSQHLCFKKYTLIQEDCEFILDFSFVLIGHLWIMTILLFFSDAYFLLYQLETTATWIEMMNGEYLWLYRFSIRLKNFLFLVSFIMNGY